MPALTLTLVEREPPMDASGEPLNREIHSARSTIPLLLGGEGRDEGGRDSQLNRSGCGFPNPPAKKRLSEFSFNGHYLMNALAG